MVRFAKQDRTQQTFAVEGFPGTFGLRQTVGMRTQAERLRAEYTRLTGAS